jgi:hypothetical protein
MVNRQLAEITRDRPLASPLPPTQDEAVEARRSIIMRQLRIGDPWVEAHQMRPEELLAEARVYAAQRAIFRGAPRTRRAGRRRTASALGAIGRNLLRLVSRVSVGILGGDSVALKRDG